MKKAFLIILLFNVFRLILIAFVDTLPHEQVFMDKFQAHMFIQSSMALWVAGLTIIPFGKSIIGIRIVFFIISLISQWGIYLITKKIIRSERKYLSWVVISTTLPITLISITAFNDALLIMFWVISIITLYNAIFNNHKLSWLLSGIFIGLAVLNKLSGLMLPIGLFLFLIFSFRYRKNLFTTGPYISLLLAAILSIPIWLGIFDTSNSSIQIQLIETFSHFINLPINPSLGFIGFQLVLIFPVLYIGLWWITFKYLGRIFKKPNQVNPEFWFLFSFFLPPFIGFHLMSLLSWVDFLGLIPFYLTGAIVLLKVIKKRWIYWSISFSVIAHIILLIGLFYI